MCCEFRACGTLHQHVKAHDAEAALLCLLCYKFNPLIHSCLLNSLVSKAVYSYWRSFTNSYSCCTRTSCFLSSCHLSHFHPSLFCPCPFPAFLSSYHVLAFSSFVPKFTCSVCKLCEIACQSRACNPHQNCTCWFFCKMWHLMAAILPMNNKGEWSRPLHSFLNTPLCHILSVFLYIVCMDSRQSVFRDMNH